MEGIKVSVCCLTYNHEPYVADTLEGFVSQKCDFQFEVLIHDDASTDRTAQIVREYAEKYPTIIKPIYQNENQYSKKVWIMKDILIPRACGKYIALCEGDDFWIDPYKLQKQVDYMEEHPDCTLCFTNGKRLVGNKYQDRILQNKGDLTRFYKMGDCNYNMGEMTLLDYVPTASLLFPKKVYDTLPTISQNAFRGDTYIRLYLTYKGYAHCIDEDMVVYRYNPSSVVSSWKQDNLKYANAISRINNLYREMDKISEGRYSEQLKYMIIHNEIDELYLLGKYKELRCKKYDEFAKKVSRKYYTKYIMKSYFHGLFELLKKCKTIKHGHQK